MSGIIFSLALSWDRSRQLWTVTFLAAAVSFAYIEMAAAEIVIGHVAALHGDWKLYPGGAESTDAQTIAFGQGVPAGAAIRIRAPTPDDHIVIMGLDLKPLEQRRCGEESCNLPILLPKKPKQQSFPSKFVSLLGEAWSQLERESFLPSLHRVRGPLMMTDGVVALKDHSIDLGDIMRYARAGHYVLTRTEDADRQLKEAQRTAFAWDPHSTTTVPVGDLSPGLFDINKESTVAARLPGKDPGARILICSLSTYLDAASSFRKARDNTDSWNGSIDPDTTRAFLRSLLMSLDKNIGAGTYSKRR